MLATAAVLLKSVPLGGQPLRVVDGALTRNGLPHGIDPVNEVALEWALRLRAAGQLASVTAITMAPADAKDTLRRALAMGCDEVMHVTDPRLEGADVRTTARVLAAAVRRLHAELALFGYESLDGSSGLVPAAVAAFLERSLISRGRTLAALGGRVSVERDVGSGSERVATDLPAVVSLTEGGAIPRYPTVRDVLGARARDVTTVDLHGLGLDAAPTTWADRVIGLDRVAQQPRDPVVLEGEDGVVRLLDLLHKVEHG